jgi:hypothetical protein
MRRDNAGRVTPTIVAVVSVAAIAVALVAFLLDGGRESDEKTVVADQSRSDQHSSDQQSPDQQGPDQQGAAQHSTAEASAVPDSRPKPDPRKQKAKPKPSPTSGVPDVYVEVYNMTSVTGLAAAKAAQLQDVGWQVVGIDNWRGNIPSSTVYYPGGMADEAGQLAKTLGIWRTRGAVSPMKFDRLTVILTSDAT